MGRDAVGTEAVIEDGFHNDIVADDIVVHRKREMRHAHSVVSEVDGMDARGAGQLHECLVDGLHEMPDYPSPVGCVEILGLGEVELGKGGDAGGFTSAGRRRGR